MTTKITWTHVDAHVRKNCEQAGVLELGATDAEVAYNYLRYVERQLELLSRQVHHAEEERDAFRKVEASPVKQGKTKRRLDALEKTVAELQKGVFEMLYATTYETLLNGHAPKADPFGPRDADGWYAWNGGDTMLPAGRVDVILRDCEDIHTWDAGNIRWKFSKTDPEGDVVKWRPAQ